MRSVYELRAYRIENEGGPILSLLFAGEPDASEETEVHGLCRVG